MEDIKEKPNYYAIIPANVRYDSKLKANAKLLYGEITSLTDKTGECWATNDYFAELYNVNKETISRWISQLKEYGYIDVQILRKEENKEIEKRVIKIVNVAVNNRTETQEEPVPPIEENTNLAEDFDKLWRIYPRKDGKNQAFNHYKAWIKGKDYAGKKEKLTNPEMWYAIRIYQCNIKINKTEKQYIKMGSTFFNESIYEYANYYRQNPVGWENKIKEILESE